MKIHIRLKFVANQFRATGAGTYEDRFFGLNVPVSIDGVPDEVLRPSDTWADSEAYDRQAQKLANMFVENFEQFAGDVSQEIVNAGPQNSQG